MTKQTFTSNGNWSRTNNTTAGKFRHERVFVIAIGAGGGGDGHGGGGGGGAAWGVIDMQGNNGNTLQVSVGDGGQYDDGGDSRVRLGNNNNIKVQGNGGNQGDYYSGGNGDGGGRDTDGVSNSGGDNGEDGNNINVLCSNTPALDLVETSQGDGGAAGGASGGGQGYVMRNDPSDPEDSSECYNAGGGGDGSAIKNSGSGGNGSPVKDNGGGQNGTIDSSDEEDLDADGGDGGNYGGGGGGSAGYWDGRSGSGRGANGVCYVTYLDLDNIPSDVQAGQTFTIRKKSYWDGNSNESFTAGTNDSGLKSYTLTDSRGNRSRAYVNVVPPPSIEDFFANPNPQNSGNDGVPNYDTKLYWSFTAPAGSTYKIRQGGNNGTVLATNPSEPYNITNLPQSTAGTNSPRTRNYTLEVDNGYGVKVYETITVSVRNDAVPSNSWTKTFSDLEPNLTNHTESLGTISGVDMIIKASSPDSAIFFSKNGSNGWANPKNFENGDTVYVRTSTLPFNTDISGLSDNATFGKTNTKTFSVSVGDGSSNTFDVNYVTRKPKIKESFDLDGEIGAYPDPDIDLRPGDPTPPTRLFTETEQTDDIEIDMEIKGDDPNIQVKINNGTWKNIRQM
jgi:hypothetical protein